MKSDPTSKTIQETTKQQLFEDGKREEMLVSALQECQAIIDSGQEIDRDEILKKYPDIQGELSSCFEGLQLMNEFKACDANSPTEQTVFVSSDQLSPSATLGDFRLKRELGRGGMGVVYEAEQLSVGRRVALKVLPYAAMLDKRQVARFQNEARAAATLEHPHIVPVYFVGNDRGVYYYAMRLIEGKNLSQLLKDLRENSEDLLPLPSLSAHLVERISRASNSTSQTRDSLAESTRTNGRSDSRTISNTNVSKRVYFDSIAEIAMQAASALDFAHTHGILHRDVKPANIILDELGDAWVTDFGLARIETEGNVTMTGDLVGTLRYMSPEQTLAKRVVVDHRSDVYSLGATLYELIALRPAFDGEDRAALLKKIAFEEPKPPSSIDSRIPQDLDTIVLKAMQKRPEDRYNTAQEMAEDLERFRRRQPIRARRTSLARRLNMWRTRHPLAVSTIALGIALLSTLTIGAPFLWMQRVAREQAEKIANQAQRISDTNAARAATQEYFASVSKVRELNALRPLGWTWDVLEGIQRVAQLDADGKDLLQLRSLAANALAGIDVQLIQEFAEGIDPGAIASSQDGRLLAIGEVRPAPNANVPRIYIYEVASTLDRVSLTRTLDLPGNRGLLGSIVQRVSGGPEGIRSLCFSNHGKRLAIGTRYGQILDWDLESDHGPIEISEAKSDENERVTGLKYSPDDGYLVARIGGINALRIIDLSKPNYSSWDHPWKYECFTFAEDGRLLFQNSENLLVEIDELDNPNPRTIKSLGKYAKFKSERISSAGVISDRSSLGPVVSFVDFQCGANSIRIDVAPSHADSGYGQLEFGPSNQTVIGVKHGNQFSVWDGLSGSKLFDLPRTETVYAKHAVADSTGLWAISGSPGSALYRWRNPRRSTDERSDRGGEASVMKTLTSGAWPIQAFDLSEDGENIALVESNVGRNYQVRVRSFALHNGKEEGCWTLRGDAKGPYPLRSLGTDVLYTYGGNIIAACKEVGVPMVLGKNGIHFPADIARPMIAAVGRVDDGKVIFDFPESPPLAKPYEQLALGFSMRFKPGSREKLVAEGQVIRMEIFVDGESRIARELSVEPYLTIGAEGWYSQLAVSLDETNQPIRLEVSLRNPSANEELTLEPGTGHLMATLGEHAAPYWLGPYAIQGNGKIVAADAGTILTSRDTSLSAPDWKWTDTLNEFATIRAIDASENSAVFGTRWGHVYLVDAQREVRQLNSIGKSHGGDVEEEVASVAIDRRGKIAASGSLDGKVTLFDLAGRKPKQHVSQIQAHKEAVSSIALHRDGSLLATASEDSKLKVWHVEAQGLKLWFELALENPVLDLQFSPANEQVFVLCRRERGIRILDLDAIDQKFEILGIGDSSLRGD